MRRVSILLLACLLSAFMIGCSNKSQLTDEEKSQEIYKVYFDNGIKEAKKRVEKLYPKDIEKQKEWDSKLSTLNTDEDTKYDKKLEIQDGWKVETKGNYVYIRGRVKNTGKVDINYFKITAEFLDSKGNILDTDYTNSNQTIKPNAQKEFEIMHKYDSLYAKYKIIVDETK